MGGVKVCEFALSSEKLFQVPVHLFISQPRPFVSLCMFLVAFAEFFEIDFYRPFEDAPKNFRLSNCEKCLGIALDGTVRRLLRSFSVLIVVVDPPNTASLIDSHVRLLFYPLPAARVFYAKAGRNAKIYC